MPDECPFKSSALIQILRAHLNCSRFELLAIFSRFELLAISALEACDLNCSRLWQPAGQSIDRSSPFSPSWPAPAMVIPILLSECSWLSALAASAAQRIHLLIAHRHRPPAEFPGLMNCFHLSMNCSHLPAAHRHRPPAELPGLANRLLPGARASVQPIPMIADSFILALHPAARALCRPADSDAVAAAHAAASRHPGRIGSFH